MRLAIEPQDTAEVGYGREDTAETGCRIDDMQYYTFIFQVVQRTRCVKLLENIGHPKAEHETERTSCTAVEDFNGLDIIGCTN